MANPNIDPSSKNLRASRMMADRLGSGHIPKWDTARQNFIDQGRTGTVGYSPPAQKTPSPSFLQRWGNAIRPSNSSGSVTGANSTPPRGPLNPLNRPPLPTGVTPAPTEIRPTMTIGGNSVPIHKGQMAWKLQTPDFSITRPAAGRTVGALGPALGAVQLALTPRDIGVGKGESPDDMMAQRRQYEQHKADLDADIERNEWYGNRGKEVPDFATPEGRAKWLGVSQGESQLSTSPSQVQQPLGTVKKLDGTTVSYSDWRAARPPSPGGTTMVGMSNDKPILGGGNLSTLTRKTMDVDRTIYDGKTGNTWLALPKAKVGYVGQENISADAVRSEPTKSWAPEINQSNYKNVSADLQNNAGATPLRGGQVRLYEGDKERLADANILPRRYADGGYIDPRLGPPGTDTIPAIVANKTPVKLDGGEYVLPEDTVDAIGVRNLDRIVAKTHTPQEMKFADGGKIPEKGSFYDSYPQHLVGEMRGPRSDALYDTGSAIKPLLPNSGDSLQKLGAGMRLEPHNYAGTTAEVAALTAPFGPKSINIVGRTPAEAWMAARANATPGNIGRAAAQTVADDYPILQRTERGGVWWNSPPRGVGGSLGYHPPPQNVGQYIKERIFRNPEGRSEAALIQIARGADDDIEEGFLGMFKPGEGERYLTLEDRLLTENRERMHRLAAKAANFYLPDAIRKKARELMHEHSAEGQLAHAYKLGKQTLRTLDPNASIPSYSYASSMTNLKSRLDGLKAEEMAKKAKAEIDAEAKSGFSELVENIRRNRLVLQAMNMADSYDKPIRDRNIQTIERPFGEIPQND